MLIHGIIRDLQDTSMANSRSRLKNMSHANVIQIGNIIVLFALQRLC